MKLARFQPFRVSPREQHRDDLALGCSCGLLSSWRKQFVRTTSHVHNLRIFSPLISAVSVWISALFSQQNMHHFNPLSRLVIRVYHCTLTLNRTCTRCTTHINLLVEILCVATVFIDNHCPLASHSWHTSHQLITRNFYVIASIS